MSRWKQSINASFGFNMEMLLAWDALEKTCKATSEEL